KDYSVRATNEDYTFINPLLFYGSPKSNDRYPVLVSKIQNQIASSGVIASVYYRDLSNGDWVGINEDAKYEPASLLKVVIMMAYFKDAESDPDLLTKRILYSKSIANMIGTIPFDEGTSLKIGDDFSVSVLIDMMMTQSDNGATYALLSQIDNSVLSQIFKDLNLQNPEITGREFTL